MYIYVKRGGLLPRPRVLLPESNGDDPGSDCSEATSVMFDSVKPRPLNGFRLNSIQLRLPYVFKCPTYVAFA